MTEIHDQARRLVADIERLNDSSNVYQNGFTQVKTEDTYRQLAVLLGSTEDRNRILAAVKVLGFAVDAEYNATQTRSVALITEAHRFRCFARDTVFELLWTLDKEGKEIEVS